MQQTIAAIMTPPGTGGIAAVRLSGENATEVAARVFKPYDPGRSLAAAPGYTAFYGHFYHRGHRRDQSVALLFRGPKSYTGEDVVEISCHGGDAVSHLLLEACIEAGARPAAAGEFTKRAFLNGKLSLTQAEAVMDLVSAASKEGASAAAAALQGALYRRLQQHSIGPLTALLGHLAAWTDYPEEDVPALEQQQLETTLSAVEQELQSLIAGYGAGAILQRGVDTAIVGRPNVGKSTLLNLLSGYERAIVTAEPGTTRDIVEETVSIGGIPCRLADTAGLRNTENLIEKEGIRRAKERLAGAGLVLAVFDGSQPFTDEDKVIAALCQGRPAIGILNKQDLPQKTTETDLKPYFQHILTLSAIDPAHRQRLEQAVKQVLGVSAIDPDAGMLGSLRQLEAARRALTAVQEARGAAAQGLTLDAIGVCAEDALAALLELSGENASDAVVDDVFSRFCVGK